MVNLNPLDRWGKRNGFGEDANTAGKQEIAQKHYYRPIDKKVAAKYARQFPKLKLVTIDDTFGGWSKAQKTHFSDGGVFDQIYGGAR